MRKLKYSLAIPLIALFFFSCKDASNRKIIQPDRKKPNVILIMTDDQGYGDLGRHGSPYVKTPALDALYDESVRLTDFHVDPSCSPTRSALLTGNYSARAGVWHTIGGRSLLKEGMPTMPEIFAANGYETGIFGKWHLGENYPFRPMDRGFKESIVHGGGGIGQNPDYWGNNYYDDTYKHNGAFEKYEGYCNNVWFGEAINYIKENKDKPFFCYIPTNLPHAPLLVDEKYVDPYKGQVSDRLAKYYGMISKMDEDVATLLNEVKKMGLEENTIVIFMTDNGPCPWFGGVVIDFETGFAEEGYTDGLRGGKIWGYENAHRVPFFMRWPNGGIEGGKDLDMLSGHIDVMPTLLELCGLELPKELQIDGRSIVPFLEGETKEWKDDRTFFTHNQRVEYPVKDKEYEVLTEKWRLVKRAENELYDIDNDREEKFNIADQHPEVVKELYGRYDEWWTDVSVDFDKYAAIHVGTPFENPVKLYSHDAHTRKGKKVWVIDVAKTGKYKIEVNRWRAESGKRMVENYAGDKEIAIKDAWLKIGNLEQLKTVDHKMKAATFEVALKAGTTCFEAAINLMDNGKIVSPECIYVTYLGDAKEDELGVYVASVPDERLREGYEQKVIPFD
ncbi:arylsulfatase [Cellulophaga sp. F20128]|uniref:arylsulfatase n=1 Tax=Cellulophaga sp. F20128 TaxID=2926413 RepID=UPI001FF48A63|nr:arylsulfatase [Cellulophaga sp. F20128]MCK0156455.1 arylsulfatase [Cellulophaga sp. F20128]